MFAGYAVFAGLQSEGHQVVGGEGVVQSGGQGPLEEGVDLLVGLEQGVGVLGVGGQALQTVGDELPQRADVLIFGGEHAHLGGLLLPVAGAVPPGGGGEGGGILDLGQQGGLGRQGIPDALEDGLLVKVGVGDGGEEVEGDELVEGSGDGLALGTQGGGDSGEPLGHIDQQVLGVGHLGGLAAHAGTGASGAAGGLLALIAEHLVFHRLNSFFMAGASCGR